MCIGTTSNVWSCFSHSLFFRLQVAVRYSCGTYCAPPPGGLSNGTTCDVFHPLYIYVVRSYPRYTDFAGSRNLVLSSKSVRMRAVDKLLRRGVLLIMAQSVTPKYPAASVPGGKHGWLDGFLVTTDLYFEEREGFKIFHGEQKASCGRAGASHLFVSYYSTAEEWIGTEKLIEAHVLLH